MRVLYIIGKGRSGSTLLDISLNSIPGFFSTGELWRRWGNMRLEEYECGCGERVGTCELWSRVIPRAVTRTARRIGADVTSEQVLTWERAVLRWSKIPQLISLEHPSNDPESECGKLAIFMSALYQELLTLTGADVIVDSSKTPFLLGPLGHLEGIEAHLLHLVRDSRAVSHSWRRQKYFLPDHQHPMPTYGPIYSAASWNARNALAEYAGRHGSVRYLRVRYEDFVDRPEPTLNSIIDFLGLESRSLPIKQEHTLSIASNHTVWGNKSRFLTGEVVLRRDVEWQTKMSTTDRLLVTTLTWPLLRRYGYPLSGRK